MHVAGEVSPADDIEIINTELALADLDTVERAADRVRRMAGSGDKEAAALMALLEQVREGLEAGAPVRSLALDGNARARLRANCTLLTAKPVLYIANVTEDGFDDNALLDQVAAVAAQEGAPVVPICNRIEAEIAELDEAERGEFLDAPRHQRARPEPRDSSGLQPARPAPLLHGRAEGGPGLDHCRRHPAPQAASVIHTDFEKGFIRAEVVGYEDFIACGGEQGAKDAGKWRLEGKDYVVADGDLMHFRFQRVK